MPVGDVAHLGLQEVEALGDLGRDLAHGQHVDPRRRQQDPQRQPAGQTQDRAQGVEVLALQREPGVSALRRIDEQVDAGRLEGFIRRVPGRVEAGQRGDGLARDVELGARGDQHLDRSRGLQDLGHDGRRRP